MKWLVRCYPPTWRRRYEAEFVALLEDCGLNPSMTFDVVRGALSMHLESHLFAWGRDAWQSWLIVAGLGAALATVILGVLVPSVAYSYGFVALIGVGFLIGRWWSALLWLAIVWIAAPFSALGIMPGPFDLGMWLLFSGLSISLTWLGVGGRVAVRWSVRRLKT